MIRFLTDEDFDNDVLRGVLRRVPDLDIVRVQDVGLAGRHDTQVLAWAAADGRILLTHDAGTMKTFAYLRIENGERMPGLFVVRHGAPIARTIDDLVLIAECSTEGEWEHQVRHLPL